MPRTFRIVLAAILSVTPALLACGEDRIERGLATDDEVAVPESEHELDMTEAERQAQREADEGDAQE